MWLVVINILKDCINIVHMFQSPLLNRWSPLSDFVLNFLRSTSLTAFSRNYGFSI